MSILSQPHCEEALILSLEFSINLLFLPFFSLKSVSCEEFPLKLNLSKYQSGIYFFLSEWDYFMIHRKTVLFLRAASREGMLIAQDGYKCTRHKDLSTCERLGKVLSWAFSNCLATCPDHQRPLCPGPWQKHSFTNLLIDTKTDPICQLAGQASPTMPSNFYIYDI